MAKPNPISLAQQIEEVAQTLAERERAYQARSGGLRPSLAEFHIKRLRAVLATLKWLQTHEAAIRGAVASRLEGHFKVERWTVDDSKVEGIIAAADNMLVARAAFDTAVAQYPKARLTLRDGIRVIAKHP